MEKMAYRWYTTALLGTWCSSADEALRDALRWGQAVRNSDREIALHSFAAMEMREPSAQRATPGTRKPSARRLTAGHA
jgi:hypothetical protein